MEIFKLFGTVLVNSDEAEKSIHKTDSKAQKLAATLGNGIKTAAKWGAGLATASAAAVGAMSAIGAAVSKNVGATAEFADNIDKMSQKMGLSAEGYQEWDFIMQHSGTSMETLKASMKTLANAAETNSDAFEKLGISQKELSSMNQEELFNATLAGLQGVTDETERMYLAGKLLGRGATELGPLLNTSAEDIEAMKQQAHDVNGVLSDESVKAGAAYQDALQNMQTATGGFVKKLSAELLPGATMIMDGITAMFSGDSEGVSKIDEGLDSIVSTINEKLPEFMEFGGKIVTSILSSIVQNIPQLADGSVAIIMELASGIIALLPQLVSAGLSVITSLAQGISEALPELIPTIVGVVTQIVEILSNPDTLSVLLEASLAIILALATGLIDSLPELIDRIPEIVMNLVDALIDNAPKLLDAAWELIKALTVGLFEALPELLEKLPDLIGDIVDKLAEAASAMWDAGKELISQLWDGVKSKWEDVKTWFEEKADWIADKLFFWRESKAEMGGEESVEGSHAAGLAYVPHDNYRANLHRGEMVLNADTAGQFMAGMQTIAMTMAGGNSLQGGAGGYFKADLTLRSEDGTALGRYLVPFVREEDKSNPEVRSDG